MGRTSKPLEPFAAIGVILSPDSTRKGSDSRDHGTATAIEYGLIAAGISLAIIGSVKGLGTNLGSKFTSINTSLK